MFSLPQAACSSLSSSPGTWGCLMHILACLQWRQTQQAGRARLRQCLCSQSGALALFSQTQMRICKVARKWFAMEITTGSHLPASWCALCGAGEATNTSKCHLLPNTFQEAGVGMSPLPIDGPSRRTCWVKSGSARTQVVSLIGPAARVDSRRNNPWKKEGMRNDSMSACVSLSPSSNPGHY